MKIKHLALSTLFLLGASAASAEARYVFYFIGDGMGMGHVNAANNYSRVVLGSDTPLLMMQFPVASFVSTYSASSYITDSAAAGTALATGHKTNNSMLGVTPDTTAVVSIARRLKDEGWGVGILTSNAPDDATPGAFYAHQPKRSMYYEIDVEAVNSGYDFLGGCSLRGLQKKNGPELQKLLDESGIEIVYGADAPAPRGADRLWVLSPEGKWGNNNDIGFRIDSIEGAMTLPALTARAISHLSEKTPDRFFMMVENGLIDHGAHANDPGAVVSEVLVLQDALAEAYKFYQQHPDETLIVVTADHDTGGFATGNPARGYTSNLELLQYQRITKDHFADYWRDRVNEGWNPEWPVMRDFLADRLAFWGPIALTDDDTAELEDSFKRTFIDREGFNKKGLYNTFNGFVDKVFEVYNRHCGTGFISGNHTGNPVPVFAIGAGSERFNGFHDNTELPGLIYEATRK